MAEMCSRVELDAILRATLGTTNVYYDPPESFKLKYPCIVYHDSGRIVWKADNQTYIKYRRYMLNYITPNADDPKVDVIEELPFCKMATPYASDGLFHYPYNIDF